MVSGHPYTVVLCMILSVHFLHNEQQPTIIIPLRVIYVVFTTGMSRVVCFFIDCRKTTEGKRVCDTHVGAGVEAVSFNPLNWKQICVISKNSMRLWTLEQTMHSNLFKDMYEPMLYPTH